MPIQQLYLGSGGSAGCCEWACDAASAAATSVIVDKTKGQLKYSDIKYHKFSDHLNYLLRK